LLSQADKPTEEIVVTLINLMDTEEEQKLLQQWFTIGKSFKAGYFGNSKE
jgi:hypothetical protein